MDDDDIDSNDDRPCQVKVTKYGFGSDDDDELDSPEGSPASMSSVVSDTHECEDALVGLRIRQLFASGCNGEWWWVGFSCLQSDLYQKLEGLSFFWEKGGV